MNITKLAALAVLMSAVALSACGGSSGGDDDGDSSPTPTPTPEVKPTPEVTPPPEVKPPPVTKTELEGKWIWTQGGNQGYSEGSYTFSGNEYDYYSSYDSYWPSIGDGLCQEPGVSDPPIPCFSESTEYGKIVIGDSFINSSGEEVTEIDFNRELVDGESSSKKILQTYLIGDGRFSDKGLRLGDRSGNLSDTVYEGGN